MTSFKRNRMDDCPILLVGTASVEWFNNAKTFMHYSKVVSPKPETNGPLFTSSICVFSVSTCLPFYTVRFSANHDFFFFDNNIDNEWSSLPTSPDPHREANLFETALSNNYNQVFFHC